MTNNLKADIEKIVKDHWETPAFINSTNEETVEKLLALINQKEKEARLEESKRYKEWFNNDDSTYIEDFIEDRIKQLKEELKEGEV